MRKLSMILLLFVLSASACDKDKPTGSASLPAGKAAAALNLTSPSVSATADHESVSLSWGAVSGAYKYEVVRDGNIIGSTKSTSYTDSGLKPATSYSYGVAAWNIDGEQGPYGSVSITTASGPGTTEDEEEEEPDLSTPENEEGKQPEPPPNTITKTPDAPVQENLITARSHQDDNSEGDVVHLPAPSATFQEVSNAVRGNDQTDRKDYFIIDLSVASRLTLQLVFSDADADLFLYDDDPATGNLLASKAEEFDPSGDYVVTETMEADLSAGEYYVVVEAGDYSSDVSNAYTLKYKAGEITYSWSLTLTPHAIPEIGGVSIIKVSNNRPAFETQTITLTLGGTATEDDDFTIESKSLVVSRGTKSAQTKVTGIRDDRPNEGDETIEVTASHDGSVIDTKNIILEEYLPSYFAFYSDGRIELPAPPIGSTHWFLYFETGEIPTWGKHSKGRIFSVKEGVIDGLWAGVTYTVYGRPYRDVGGVWIGTGERTRKGSFTTDRPPCPDGEVYGGDGTQNPYLCNRIANPVLGPIEDRSLWTCANSQQDSAAIARYHNNRGETVFSWFLNRGSGIPRGQYNCVLSYEVSSDTELAVTLRPGRDTPSGVGEGLWHYRKDRNASNLSYKRDNVVEVNGVAQENFEGTSPLFVRIPGSVTAAQSCMAEGQPDGFEGVISMTTPPGKEWYLTGYPIYDVASNHAKYHRIHLTDHHFPARMCQSQ